MKIGAQLYTVRQFTQTEADFDKTINRIANMGYTCVQISGIGDIPVDKVKSICDNYKIEIILSHTNPNRLLNDIDNVIREHKIMNANYIGIGGLPFEYHNGLQGLNQFIVDYTSISRKIKKSKMKFMYHNHQYDFVEFDGKLVIDRIAEGFSEDLLGFTLDTYWVQAGGGDPAYYIKKFSGRVDTIHFKDMKILQNPDGSLIQIMAEVLDGNLNWQSIFEESKKAGVKYAFVEQDDEYVKDPFECLKLSYNNLLSQGYN